VVYVTDRSDVDVWLSSFEFFFCHWFFLLLKSFSFKPKGETLIETLIILIN